MGKTSRRPNPLWRVFRNSSRKLVEGGFETLNRFGSPPSRSSAVPASAGHKYFLDDAVDVAKMLLTTGFAIITGGGPGVMEGANKGRQEREGPFRGAEHRDTFRAGPERNIRT